MTKNYHFDYYITGSENRPVILFLHGFMGNGEDFLPIVSNLKAEYCCLTIDLPAHGKTEVLGGDECYSMPVTAAGIVNFLLSLNQDKYYVCGYSMGGRLALYLAIHFPQHFQGVILESASPGLLTAEARIQRIKSDQKIIDKLCQEDFGQFLKTWYHQPLFDSLVRHQSFPELFQKRLNNHPLKLAKSLQYMGVGQQPSLWHHLSNFKKPLLLLAGEYDSKYQAINQQIKQYCPQAQLEIIAQTGHNIHVENPLVFSEQIKLFLAKNNALQA